MQDGLISPILVRPSGEGFELIAGERRSRAIRDYTGFPGGEIVVGHICPTG